MRAQLNGKPVAPQILTSQMQTFLDHLADTVEPEDIADMDYLPDVPVEDWGQ